MLRRHPISDWGHLLKPLAGRHRIDMLYCNAGFTQPTEDEEVPCHLATEGRVGSQSDRQVAFKPFVVAASPQYTDLSANLAKAH